MTSWNDKALEKIKLLHQMRRTDQAYQEFKKIAASTKEYLRHISEVKSKVVDYSLDDAYLKRYSDLEYDSLKKRMAYENDRTRTTKYEEAIREFMDQYRQEKLNGKEDSSKD